MNINIVITILFIGHFPLILEGTYIHRTVVQTATSRYFALSCRWSDKINLYNLSEVLGLVKCSIFFYSLIYILNVRCNKV